MVVLLLLPMYFVFPLIAMARLYLKCFQSSRHVRNCCFCFSSFIHYEFFSGDTRSPLFLVWYSCLMSELAACSDGTRPSLSFGRCSMSEQGPLKRAVVVPVRHSMFLL